jgi:hypothetical protein
MISVADMLVALGNWEADQSPLLGVFESRDLEFKLTAYQLNDDKGKAEFAKDVAAMANAGGGLIVLGIETARDAALGRDKSVRIRPLAPGSVKATQLEDAARTWVYPPRRGIGIREWPDSKGNLLVSILVPASPDMGGLSLVLGPGDPPDRRTVGVPVRSGSRVDFHGAPEIYEWIRRGRLLATADVESGSGPRTDADAELDRLRVEFVDAATEGEAIFSMQAWPTSPVRLERMHDYDGIRGLFIEPPEQRWGGFGWWGLQPEVDASGGIRVSSGRLAFWITPSSVATLVVGQNYLSWAMEQWASLAPGPLINSTALTELVYEFCRAYAMILQRGDAHPSQLMFRFGFFRALEPQALRLGTGRSNSHDYALSTHPAPIDELIDEVGPVDVADGDEAPAITAALILRRLYSRFGFGTDAIPHLTEHGQRFDPKSLDDSTQ